MFQTHSECSPSPRQISLIFRHVWGQPASLNTCQQTVYTDTLSKASSDNQRRETSRQGHRLWQPWPCALSTSNIPWQAPISNGGEAEKKKTRVFVLSVRACQRPTKPSALLSHTSNTSITVTASGRVECGGGGHLKSLAPGSLASSESLLLFTKWNIN